VETVEQEEEKWRGRIMKINYINHGLNSHSKE
jgi:hypothetical protein